MAAKQAVGVKAPDGSDYVTLTDGAGNLAGLSGATVGDVNNQASAAGFQDSLTIGRYDAAVPTLTSGRFNALQLDLRGSLKTSLTSIDGTGGSNFISGGADGASNSSSGLVVFGRTELWNGTTWDLARNAVNATNSTGTGILAVGLTAQVDDTSPTAITENQFGNVRMSATRALMVAPEAYPNTATIITASSGNVANASAAATLAANATKTTYITGFQVTAAGSTAAAVVTVTVAGLITGTNSYTFVFPTGAIIAATPLTIAFPYPVPGSATNTAIVVTCPAGGAGNTNATVSAQGFQL